MAKKETKKKEVKKDTNQDKIKTLTDKITELEELNLKTVISNNNKVSKLKDKVSELEEKNIKVTISSTNKINKLKKDLKKSKRKTMIFSIIIGILFLLTLSSVIILINKEKDYKDKIEKTKEEISTEYLFLGDSITYRYNLQKFFPEYPVINSGIDGNKTEDIINEIENRVFKYKPNKIIILIGINDLTRFKTPTYVSNNIEEITDKIHEKFPKSKIYIESIYPLNYKWKEKRKDDYPELNEVLKDIIKTNKKIKKLCEKNGYTYIDIHDSLLNEDGELDGDYSDDGIHLNNDGYEITTKIIKKAITK